MLQLKKHMTKPPVNFKETFWPLLNSSEALIMYPFFLACEIILQRVLPIYGIYRIYTYITLMCPIKNSKQKSINRRKLATKK